LGTAQSGQSFPQPAADAHLLSAWLADESIPGIEYQPLPFDNVMVALLIRPDSVVESFQEDLKELKEKTNAQAPQKPQRAPGFGDP
jgi:hypothetical protein